MIFLFYCSLDSIFFIHIGEINSLLLFQSFTGILSLLILSRMFSKIFAMLKVPKRTVMDTTYFINVGKNKIGHAYE